MHELPKKRVVRRFPILDHEEQKKYHRAARNKKILQIRTQTHGSQRNEVTIKGALSKSG